MYLLSPHDLSSTPKPERLAVTEIGFQRFAGKMKLQHVLATDLASCKAQTQAPINRI